MPYAFDIFFMSQSDARATVLIGDIYECRDTGDISMHLLSEHLLLVSSAR
jgi:hypothetical protein